VQTVVLFDIDGTLVTGSPVKPSAGVGAMNEAARMATGVDGLYRLVEFAGRTDRQIARDLLRAAGRDDAPAEAVQQLLDQYFAALEAGVTQRPYLALGGVRSCVGALRAQGALVGLGTGNIRRGAETKLRSAGLHDLFEFDLGGYGDDADSRGEVLRVGARRCDPAGALPVVIVGDTPHDISAAHEIGATCVAVPTGAYDEAALRSAGADELVSMLDDAAAGVILRIAGSSRG
jgi:phosphoglycolate phosphatase